MPVIVPQRKPIVGPSPKQIEQARAEAQAALDAWTQPEEVRPGLWLCPQGRVYRAFELAEDVPKEKHPALTVEVERLSAIVTARREAYQRAWNHYEEQCRMAGVKPTLLKSPRCQCEGCRILDESIKRIMEG